MNQLVFVENNQVVTDSLTVAEVFGKRHDSVIRDIENQIMKLGEANEVEFSLHNFVDSTYKNDRGRDYRKINLTEEAFTIVAMSYVTPEAMKMKVKFIQEFKKMREALKPKTQLEILQASINQLVDQERRLSHVETRLLETEKKQENLTEIIGLNQTEWRRKVNTIINKIANSIGGGQAFQDIRKESYKRLEERGGYKLSIRLTNKQRKMALEGMAKSKIDKVNYMDVIADDSRLTEIYLAVVKEMAIKYQVEVTA